LNPEGGCYFITFCTYDSIPIHQAIPLHDQPFIDKFADYDKKHDLYSKGINLAQPSIAGIIIKVLLDYDQMLYNLLYYCIMPNHVHLVIYLGNMENSKPLGLIMKNIKGRSSREINLLLSRSGTFWQKASYDRLVRDEKELGAIGDYILENPVKAGLTDRWENWLYNYVKVS
jgi:REP element-mobilizing transposase RayT